MRLSSPSPDSQTPDSVLAGLDNDQREAVTSPVGVVVVRAGAGSGKTTVLTRRIAWRVLSETAELDRTLAITFTRQAATEMRARLAPFDLVGRPLIGTFHAVARRLMLQNLEDRNKRAPVIINNRSSLMSTVMGDDARRGGVTDVLNAIDWAHARMLSPSNAVAAMKDAGYNIPITGTRFAEVFHAYESAKKKRGVIDLNDFMTAVITEARHEPRFAESIRFQFRHISVDEAQDMNPLQYEFLRVLLPESPDVFLVGDPNQAIYGFNGADKTLFDSLPGITRGARVISLPSNYRCTPEIVEMAVSALAKDGQVANAESRRTSGVAVNLQRCATEAVELRTIIKLVQAAHGSNHGWNNIAVLVRLNAIGETIREALAAADIPVRSHRRGGDWGRAVATVSSLTNRESLQTWAADVLDTGEYSPSDADYSVAQLVRQFLDAQRSGSVDGRMFSSWLVTSADIEESDGVDVLTLHAAKGREWTFVVVAGMEKGMLPHRSARSIHAKSEEARLAYVALTRAADELAITWTDHRSGKPTGPSPFLSKLKTTEPEYVGPPPTLRKIARERTVLDPLESALEQWRLRHARAAKISPEGVLTTRQLKALVIEKPDNEQDIARITDLVFARRHAADLIQLINSVR